MKGFIAHALEGLCGDLDPDSAAFLPEGLTPGPLMSARTLLEAASENLPHIDPARFIRWWDKVAARLLASKIPLPLHADPAASLVPATLMDMAIRMNSKAVFDFAAGKKARLSSGSLFHAFHAKDPVEALGLVLDPAVPGFDVGSHVSYPDSDGNLQSAGSPLWFVVTHLDAHLPDQVLARARLAMVPMLLEAGGSMGPMHGSLLGLLASTRGRYDRARLLPLLKGRFDVNEEPGENRDYPAGLAVYLQDEPMLRWLVAEGADLDVARRRAEELGREGQSGWWEKAIGWRLAVSTPDAAGSTQPRVRL